jgi:uncharacterized protein DUF992
MVKISGMAMGAALIAGSVLAAPAQTSGGGVKAGVLTCNISSGWGFVLGSSRDIRCNYVTYGGTRSEHYDGRVTKIGVDIGYTKGGVIIWNVIAPTSDILAGALAGSYGGVTGSATVGVGVGANVLLGGFDKSIALQPLSIEGLTGLNVAGGIEGMNLTFNQS